jgi:hypothetical protein
MPNIIETVVTQPIVAGSLSGGGAFALAVQGLQFLNDLDGVYISNEGQMLAAAAAFALAVYMGSKVADIVKDGQTYRDIEALSALDYSEGNPDPQPGPASPSPV